MKQLFKYISLSISIITLFWGCEKGPNFKDYSDYYPAATASGLSPTIGFPSQEVTITGTKLDTLTGAVKVWFGGILATEVVSSNGTQIIVKVPEGAVSGKVGLQVWTHKIDSIGTFTVLPAPVINSVQPAFGLVGDTITITGEFFDEDFKLDTVFIGDTFANIISVTNTEIKIIAPDAESGVIVLVGQVRIEGSMFVIGDDKLTGTIIGHEGSFGDDSTTYINAAFDDSLTTFVDAPTTTGYVGYDFGLDVAAFLTRVRYVPRASNPERMVDGEIRGSNDSTLIDYVTLHTISEEPPVGEYSEVRIKSDISYRFIYYYSSDGYCNIAELELYGVVDQ